MYEPHRFDRPALLNLIEQKVELVLHHFVKRLVIDGGNLLFAFDAAHDAEEINHRTRTVRHFPLTQQPDFVNRLSGDG